MSAVSLQELKVGDFVGMVDVPPNVCEIPQTPPIWHIITAVPNSEKVVREGLNELGIRSYSPIIRKFVGSAQRNPNGQRKMVERSYAMFPGYVLADVRGGDADLALIAGIKGVRKPGHLAFVIGDRQVPCILNADLVSAIRQREQAEDEKFKDKLAGRKRAPFSPGECVAVAEGPFQGFFAEVAKLDDKGRVQLLISMFNGKRLTWMNGNHLEKV